jgi:hypothetical protein
MHTLLQIIGNVKLFVVAGELHNYERHYKASVLLSMCSTSDGTAHIHTLCYVIVGVTSQAQTHLVAV